MPSEKRASCFRRCCWPRSWPPRSRRRPCFCPCDGTHAAPEPGRRSGGSGWPCSVRWCWPRSRRPSCGRSAHRSTTWWRAWPVRSQGRLPAHAEDQRADQMVGSAACQLGGVHACAVRLHRHRSRADQSHPAERPAARGPAAVPHARHGRGPRQQLGRAPGPAARRTARPAAHRVPPRSPRLRGRRGDRGNRGRPRRSDRRRRSPVYRPPPRPDPEPRRPRPGQPGPRQPVPLTLCLPVHLSIHLPVRDLYP